MAPPSAPGRRWGFFIMNVQIEPSWKQYLGAEFDKPYFASLTQQVKEEYRTQQCFPPGHLIFNAFNLCPFDKVKVVIIGQDPYHEQGQAMGLSFSVPEGIVMPPSLVNIFKEIQADLGKPMPANGDLTRWARQGMLLLNATLTVRAHLANSHQRLGWSVFTDAAIKALSDHREGIVYMLWGGYALSALGQPWRVVWTAPVLTLQRVSYGSWTASHRLVKRKKHGTAYRRSGKRARFPGYFHGEILL